MSAYVDSEDLIRDFHAGEKIAYDALFDKHFSVIYGFCFNLIRQSEDAKDITIESINKLFLLRHQFQSHANIRAFLYVTSRNSCMDYFRYIKKLKEVNRHFTRREQEDNFILINDQLDGLYYQTLKKSIEKLPSRQKQAIELLFLEEMDYKAAAKYMDVTVETLYKLRARAITLLREILDSQKLTEGVMFLIILDLYIYKK